MKKFILTDDLAKRLQELAEKHPAEDIPGVEVARALGMSRKQFANFMNTGDGPVSTLDSSFQDYLCDYYMYGDPFLRPDGEPEKFFDAGMMTGESKKSLCFEAPDLLDWLEANQAAPAAPVPEQAAATPAIAELQEALDQANNRIAELQCENENLRQSSFGLDPATRLVAQFRKEQEQREKQFADMVKDVPSRAMVSLVPGGKKLLEELQSIKAEKAALQGDLASTRAALEQANSQIDALQRENEQLKQERADLEGKLALAESERPALPTGVDAGTAGAGEQEALQEELKATRDNLAALAEAVCLPVDWTQWPRYGERGNPPIARVAALRMQGFENEQIAVQLQGERAKVPNKKDGSLKNVPCFNQPQISALLDQDGSTGDLSASQVGVVLHKIAGEKSSGAYTKDGKRCLEKGKKAAQ